MPSPLRMFYRVIAAASELTVRVRRDNKWSQG
jgi:hypothetical protein